MNNETQNDANGQKNTIQIRNISGMSKYSFIKNINPKNSIMAAFNLIRIIEDSRKDFEKTWVETSELLPRNTVVNIPKNGRLHPLREMVQKSRDALYSIGFVEVENKTILPDTDVYKEYGPEAPVILDRSFYLAKLPRPDIGLSKEKISQIMQIVGEFDQEKMQEILRSYKKGEIEGDDFVEEMTTKLNIKQEHATKIMAEVFSEFRGLTPQPTNLTLRSHMSATWYHTLAALQDKQDYPIALFAVGTRYRNEQREDKSHLRVHNSTSLVVMDPQMSLEAGRKITLEFLVKMGFPDVRFETKKATSKYYAHGQEEEVFIKQNDKWLEIGDIGMYSPISLANFGIKYPVFNAGFGVERLAMIVHKKEDIRELIFPQFYAGDSSQSNILDSISLIKSPATDRGNLIAKGIEETARKYKDQIAPCEFVAYEDKEISVKITEKEEGKKLIGPAGFNEIYVEDGNILSRVETGESSLRYIESMSKGIASDIEESMSQGIEHNEFRIKMAKSLPDVNLKLPKQTANYLSGQHKRIRVGGPVFLTVEYSKKPNNI